MKILIANKFFHRNGGSETVMFQERAYLQANGHSVVDFSMQDERNLPSAHASYFVSNHDYHRAEGLQKISAAISLIHSTEAVQKFSALLDAEQPDLVHCHNIYHQITPSIIGVARKRNIPVVLTLHDYKPVCPVYNRLRNGNPCGECLSGDFSHVFKHRCADGSLAKSAIMYLEAVFQRWRGSYEDISCFIAPSQFMADSIAHRIPAERITVLYNGVTVDESRPENGDGNYVLYLGRLSHEKGVETLLKAHAASGAAWQLVIAGGGPLAEELAARYPRAQFLGHVSGTKLQDTINQASLVAVPSEWHENCPMSVLEAMANGKPVVGSRMGGIPELVEHGRTGLLFDMGNVADLQTQITTLMASSAERQRMGGNARNRAGALFSLERHNAGLLALYQRLTANRRPMD